jgi:hypothetical protein
MLYALHRMGYYGPATTRGIRAVASTILNESNMFNRDSIERPLAHVEINEVRRAYNAAERMPDRRRMMRWWVDTSLLWPRKAIELFCYRERARPSCVGPGLSLFHLCA